MIRTPIFLLGFTLLAATAMVPQTWAQQTESQQTGQLGQKKGMGSAATQSAPMGTAGITFDSSTDSQRSSISGLSMPGSAATQNSPMHSGSDYDDGTGFGRRKR